MRKKNEEGRKGIFFFLSIIFSYMFINSLFAQVPSSQTAGAIEQQRQEEEKQKALKERIQKERKEPLISEEGEPETKPLIEDQRVLIKKIVVEGVSLIPEEEIKAIASNYEGKELGLSEMQKIADSITSLYRKKGYATSRAYLPPQTIKKEEGLLIIRVVEGKVGKINIKGNKWFKIQLIKKKLQLKEGEPFDYSRLQKSLAYLNEHPDRLVKAIISPGEEAGTTDIHLEVKERLPIHLRYERDNYASRYLGADRDAIVFEHNNFMGFDDKLYFKYQRSEDSLYTLRNLRYLFPLKENLEIGGYWLYSRMRLGREFGALDSRGHSTLAGVFINKGLIGERDLDVRLNLGFDYKHIYNFLFGEAVSRDETRILKTSLDIDLTDKWGRTIFSPEISMGIPRMWGALAKKDPLASRAGAGGKFIKLAYSLYRLQALPLNSNLFLKLNGQYSNYHLLASEQFQMGGPNSVRGYPVGEYSGDEGWNFSWEWSLPYYFIPRNLRVPFTEERLFDALRFVLFYDWASTHLNNPGNDNKHRTLSGWGFGIRFNLLERLSLKLEWAYPLRETPSDGRHLHNWIEFSWQF